MMELNYKVFGEGEPLIILHGLFGSLDNWQTLAKRWAESYTVYLIDQRNHGRSPHMDTHDYPSMADDLHTFMEQNWIHRAHILGHSMGGKTAMHFALDYPDMVEKLIVVDMTPKAYEHGHAQIFQALNRVNPQAIQDRKEAERQLAESISEQGVRQFLLKNLTREKTGGFRWKMNLPVISRDYENILVSIKHDDPFPHPALFIYGEHSGYLKEEDKPLILDQFPSAEFVGLPTGHWVHAESPNALFQQVSNFIEK